MEKTSSQTPLGYYDVFKDVADWSDETAQSWTIALNLRATSVMRTAGRDAACAVFF